MRIIEVVNNRLFVFGIINADRVKELKEDLYEGGVINKKEASFL